MTKWARLFPLFALFVLLELFFLASIGPPNAGATLMLGWSPLRFIGLLTSSSASGASSVSSDVALQAFFYFLLTVAFAVLVLCTVAAFWLPYFRLQRERLMKRVHSSE